MLLNLFVKNLALIEEVDIGFGEGLNILTGETGAGKSVIIGSVNLALGQKLPKDIIRKGKDYAYVELLFSVKDRQKEESLREMDVYPDEDGQIIISRKIMPSRSVCKINDETVTTAKVKQVTGVLLDIHGQHEHQSLLYKAKHLEILDEFAGLQIAEQKKEIEAAYKEYNSLKEKLESYRLDEESRNRQMDFLRFEINEIEASELKEGEEELLSAQYRKCKNSKKIAEGVSAIQKELSGDVSCVRDRIERALKEFSQIMEYDAGLSKIEEQLEDADAIIGEINREINDYIDEISFDESEFRNMESRLDLIHNLQAKYGDTYDKIIDNLLEKQRELSELENYQVKKQEVEKQLMDCHTLLEERSRKLSAIRKKQAGKLSERIRQALLDLNFLDVKFEISFERTSGFTRHGFDSVEFLISTNPGESLKPLGQVASGGELSRIMLAIKSVLADSDQIPTLIFDEIDTGISGRTAQMVSEKLSVIGENRQIICITHLPQIAAMADFHFAIEKNVISEQTVTMIHKLTDEESVQELARLLGGAQITDTVMIHAAEMKELAQKTKRS